jgi:O-antigen/teichoic acid export membrane protein
LALHRVIANRSMLLNAASLIGTSVVTSGFGFVYWWVAARLFTAEAIGLAAAVISAMALLGTAGMLGLSTLLIGELPRHRGREGPLLATSLIVCGAAGAVLGLAFALVGVRAFPELGSLGADLTTVVLFAAGVGLTGLALVLDQALVGLLRGGLQLARNAIFSSAKLGALLVAPLLLASSATVIWGTWIVGLIVSLAALVVVAAWHGVSPARCRPTWGFLRALGREALLHHVLNLSLNLPSLAMPIVVTATVSTAGAAYFYTAVMISGLTTVAPLALTTALYAVGARTPRALPERLRFTLLASVVLVAGANVVLFVGADFLLRLFGDAYADHAAWVLRVMALLVFARIVQDSFVVICRLQRRLASATGVIAVTSGIELGLAAFGGLQGGLLGLAVGWTIGAFLQAIVMLPLVLEQAFPAWWARRRAPLFGATIRDSQASTR